MAGLEVVVAQHADDRDFRLVCELARQPTCFVRQPVIGEVATDEDQIRGGRHLREERPQDLGGVAAVVQIRDGGDAHVARVSHVRPSVNSRGSR